NPKSGSARRFEQPPAKVPGVSLVVRRLVRRTIRSGPLTISAKPVGFGLRLSRCRLDMQRIERKSGRLESSSALNKVNDQDDDGNYEQEVDQAAANVANEAKKPE